MGLTTVEASCGTVIMPLTRMLCCFFSEDTRPIISAPLESSQSPPLPPLYTLEHGELLLARLHAENPISIEPAESRHLTSMARIHLAACPSDDLVQQLYGDEIHWNITNDMLEERLQNRPYIMSVAINEKLERIVGWVCCSVVGQVGIRRQDAHLSWKVAAAFKAAEAQRQLTRTSGESEPRHRHEQRMTFRDAIVSRTKVAQSLAMGDNVYLVINNVATDSRNSLGGVTSRLICSVTESADRDGLSVFAQVPSYDMEEFEWAGFQQIAGFEPQMDIHQLQFMVRKPRIIAGVTA